MKPIRLVLSGFGPFAQETEVDFEKVGENGIFLISGDTGSGKTTIFDGVVFALFGESSGEMRKANSLRSGFAGPKTKSYVDFTFSHQGKMYRVIRNPEYKRASSRGKDLGVLATEKKNATLYLPDGIEISGYEKVTKQVVELLHLNKVQFKQIAMLAQGEFVRFLNAKSEERSAIFRQVFGTESYLELQRRLGNREREASSEYGKYREQQMQTLRMVSIITEEEAWDDSLERENIEELRELLMGILENQEQEVGSLTQQSKEIAKKKEEAAVTFSKVDELVQRFVKLKENKRQIEDEKENIAEAVKQLLMRKEAHQDAKESYEDACKQQMQLQEILPLYEKRDAKRKEQKSLFSQWNQEAKQVEVLNELSRLAVRILEHRSEVEKTEEVHNRWMAYDRLQEKLQEQQKVFLAKQQDYEAARTLMEERERLYLEGQAGILAMNLQEGMPCPVCGSTKHPQRATCEEEVPTDEQVKQSKLQCQAKQKAYQQASEEASKTRAQMEQWEAETHPTREETQTKWDQLMEEKENMQESWKRFSAKVSGEVTLENASECAEKMVEQERECKLKLVAVESQLQELEKRLEYEDAGEVQDRLRHSTAQKDSWEKEEHAITKFHTEVEARKAALVQREVAYEEDKKMAPAEMPDTSKEQEQCEMWQQRWDEVSAQLQKWNNAWKQNMQVQEQVETIEKRKEKSKQEYLLVKRISQTANGNIPGKYRVDFEKYVQGYYFKQVVAEANKRLRKMTNGKFELQAQEGGANLRSQTGLDLEVKDYYTGMVRSVSSLSGGESFKAALSLSLGMSDVMQHFAGGIQMEAMFVDEGFGSLDSESLEQAIQVLNDLSGGNCTVGIISHVQELKERIGKQILVSKTKDGSFLETIV